VAAQKIGYFIAVTNQNLVLAQYLSTPLDFDGSFFAHWKVAGYKM
jgi:hypothetical protein